MEGTLWTADTLVRLIGAQSDAEVAEVATEGRERAKRIGDAARAQAEALRQAAQRQGEERGRRRAAELEAVADAEGRVLVLQARDALLETVLQRAGERLEELESAPSAAETLAALVRQGLPLFPPGAVRVRLSARGDAALDETHRRDLEQGGWKLRVETDTIPGGGVILATEDGRLRLDNSFAARLERRRNQVRWMAAQTLHIEDEDEGQAP